MIREWETEIQGTKSETKLSKERNRKMWPCYKNAKKPDTSSQL